MSVTHKPSSSIKDSNNDKRRIIEELINYAIRTMNNNDLPHLNDALISAERAYILARRYDYSYLAHQAEQLVYKIRKKIQELMS